MKRRTLSHEVQHATLFLDDKRGICQIVPFKMRLRETPSCAKPGSGRNSGCQHKHNESEINPHESAAGCVGRAFYPLMNSAELGKSYRVRDKTKLKFGR